MVFPSIEDRYDVEFGTQIYGDENFIFSLITGERSLRILDLCSGPGRLAFPLAQKGHTLDCVDNNSAMLNIINNKLEVASGELKTRINSHDASLADLDVLSNLAFKADLILWMGSSTGVFHSDVESLQGFLRKIFRSMRSGARFICAQRNVSTYEHALSDSPMAMSFCLANGFKYQRTTQIELGKNHYTFLFKYYSGKRLFHEDRIRLNQFSNDDLLKSFVGVFGDNVESFGSYQKDKLSSDSKYGVFVCEK